MLREFMNKVVNKEYPSFDQMRDNFYEMIDINEFNQINSYLITLFSFYEGKQLTEKLDEKRFILILRILCYIEERSISNVYYNLDFKFEPNNELPMLYITLYFNGTMTISTSDKNTNKLLYSYAKKREEGMISMAGYIKITSYDANTKEALDILLNIGER